MALETAKVQLPRDVATRLLGKMKDVSTIAALSASEPQRFADKSYIVFYPSAEAEVVAEGAKKTAYEQELEPVTAKRVKVVTTTRVSNELKWADEDDQLEIVNSILQDQNEALSRALDYVVYHAISPKSGAVLEGYTSLVSQANEVTATDDRAADVDAMADALVDYAISGLALSPKMASDLRKIRVPATGMRLYPEIPLTLQPGILDGIPAVTSGTVNGRCAVTPTKVLGIMGNFEMIKWGMIRDIYSELIEYGDPDNIGQDLKGANQVAYRTEAELAYAVLDHKAFAVLKQAE